MNLNHHNLPKVSPHPAAAPAGSEIRYPPRSDRHNVRAHEEDRT